MFNDLVEEEALAKKEADLETLIHKNTVGVLNQWIPFADKCLKITKFLNGGFLGNSFKFNGFKLKHKEDTFGIWHVMKLYIDGKRVVKIEFTTFPKVRVTSLKWDPVYKKEIERFYIEATSTIEEHLEQNLHNEEKISAEQELIMFG